MNPYHHSLIYLPFPFDQGEVGVSGINTPLNAVCPRVAVLTVDHGRHIGRKGRTMRNGIVASPALDLLVCGVDLVQRFRCHDMVTLAVTVAGQTTILRHPTLPFYLALVTGSIATGLVREQLLVIDRQRTAPDDLTGQFVTA